MTAKLHPVLFLILFLLVSCQKNEEVFSNYEHPEFIGNWRVIERGEAYTNDSLQFTTVRFFKLDIMDDERGKYLKPNNQGAIDFLYTYIASEEKVILVPLSDEQICVQEDTYSVLEKGNDTMLWKTVFTWITADGNQDKQVFYWELIKLL